MLSLFYYDKSDTVNVVKDVVKENHEKTIKMISKNNKVTASQIAQELNISDRQAQRVLKKLTDNGTISRIGGRKNGHWEIMPKSD